MSPLWCFIFCLTVATATKPLARREQKFGRASLEERLARIESQLAATQSETDNVDEGVDRVEAFEAKFRTLSSEERGMVLEQLARLVADEDSVQDAVKQADTGKSTPGEKWKKKADEIKHEIKRQIRERAVALCKEMVAGESDAEAESQGDVCTCLDGAWQLEDTTQRDAARKTCWEDAVKKFKELMRSAGENCKDSSSENRPEVCICLENALATAGEVLTKKRKAGEALQKCVEEAGERFRVILGEKKDQFTTAVESSLLAVNDQTAAAEMQHEKVDDDYAGDGPRSEWR